MNRERERVIIDTDPGVDDFLALSLALSCPDIHVEAITIVFGNHYDIELLARNAAYILELTRHKCPVYKGESRPFVRETFLSEGPTIHGSNGLGNIPVSVSEEYLALINHDISASDFMINHCAQNPGQITIITLGPMANLGKALHKCPELPNYVKRVSSMAGAVYHHGNVSPVAEANVYNDPEAARLVFNAPWKEFTISPLDVTTKLNMNENFLNEMKEIKVIGPPLYESHCFYIDALSHFPDKEETMPVHDPTAVMWLIAPNIFTSKDVYVDIETSGLRTSGMCVADNYGFYSKEENWSCKTKVLLNVDSTEYMKTLFGLIRHRMELVYPITTTVN